jgi:hypothetical protein
MQGVVAHEKPWILRVFGVDPGGRVIGSGLVGPGNAGTF